MQVAVAYSEPDNQVWVRIEVPEGTSVEQAIVRAGILRRFPGIDLTRQKVGIHGRLTKLDTILQPGDRVEIYRDIIADPRTVPRRNRGKMEDDD